MYQKKKHFQVRLFTTEAMTSSVECWQWLITAKPELQVRFLQEMSSAWHYTVQKRMGLFSEAPSQISPLAKHEGKNKLSRFLLRSERIKFLISAGVKLQPNPPFVKPHAVWVNFIGELVETAKYSSYEVVEILATLIHRSLAMSVGSLIPNQTRDVSAVGVRFK